MPVHFDIEHWADFVRGLAEPGQQVQMSEHLAQGCPRCSQQVSLLRRLADSASGIRMASAAPEAVVERALTIFRTAPEGGRSGLRRLIAALVFDSAGEPALAGVRSLRSGTRRLSYRADNFAIDLLADSDRRLKSVMITGQLSYQGEPAAEVAHVPVQLRSGRRVLRQTETNESGEFQLDSPLVKSLILRVSHKTGGVELNMPLQIDDAPRRNRS